MFIFFSFQFIRKKVSSFLSLEFLDDPICLFTFFAFFNEFLFCCCLLVWILSSFYWALDLDSINCCNSIHSYLFEEEREKKKRIFFVKCVLFFLKNVFVCYLDLTTKNRDERLIEIEQEFCFNILFFFYKGLLTKIEEEKYNSMNLFYILYLFQVHSKVIFSVIVCFYHSER